MTCDKIVIIDVHIISPLLASMKRNPENWGFTQLCALGLHTIVRGKVCINNYGRPAENLGFTQSSIVQVRRPYFSHALLNSENSNCNTGAVSIRAYHTGAV